MNEWKKFLVEDNEILCEPGEVSAGIIKPDGRFEYLDGSDHQEYAWNFLMDRGDNLEGLESGQQIKNHFVQKYKHIIVSNAYNMFGPDPNSLKADKWNILVSSIGDMLRKCGELSKDAWQTRIFYGFQDASGKSQTIKDRNIKRFMTALVKKKNLAEPTIDYSFLLENFRRFIKEGK
tara:strand:+ start:28347 stop:28877 length:531 start_codon:yes stop_codon:yes gene_type:complete